MQKHLYLDNHRRVFSCGYFVAEPISFESMDYGD